MNFEDFHPGQRFFCADGLWLCTDKGARVVFARRLPDPNAPAAPDSPTIVFTKLDFQRCHTELRPRSADSWLPSPFRELFQEVDGSALLPEERDRWLPLMLEACSALMRIVEPPWRNPCSLAFQLQLLRFVDHGLAQGLDRKLLQKLCDDNAFEFFSDHRWDMAAHLYEEQLPSLQEPGHPLTQDPLSLRGLLQDSRPRLRESLPRREQEFTEALSTHGPGHPETQKLFRLLRLQLRRLHPPDKDARLEALLPSPEGPQGE